MRTGALALVLLVTACSRGEGGNAAEALGNAAADFAGEDRSVAATLALAASGSGNCSARWEGQATTVQQVLDRSSALIERAIQQQGGVANLTDESLPTVAVTAPASLGFACADTWLAAIRRAGVPNVLLAPDGRPAALADFTLSDIGAPPPSVVIAIGAGGRLHWNQEAIGLGALADRLLRRAGGVEPRVEAPAGELELRPAREATFGQVYEALSAVRSGHSRVALLLPSVTPTRPPPAAPAPPANQAPANEAAPR